MSRDSPDPSGTPSAAKPRRTRAVVFWGTAALFVVAFVILHTAAQVLLLVFAGVLFGTALRGAARVLSSKLGWPVGLGLAACFAIALAGCVGLTFWIVPRVDDQLAELMKLVSSAYERVQRDLGRTEIGRRLLQGSASIEQPLGYLARAAGILATTFGVLGSLVFVFFISVYMATSPEAYRRGLLRLVSPARRDRAREVLDQLAQTMRRWLLGRIVSMAAVGITTAIGLWLLGIPLPITLGLLSGLLGFVPNIGPIVSAIPALLLAATIDPAHVGYVLVLYLAINLGDGYLLTPAIQRRAVATPPALVLTAQLLFGALWGVLGLTLATPLIACLVVIVRMVYVESVVEAPS